MTPFGDIFFGTSQFFHRTYKIFYDLCFTLVASGQEENAEKSKEEQYSD